MRIKKLEIIGFKSFKDRTVIHFDAGITGIVGPNGCGKSNIVDALIWVMGEQSAKHLRGSSMEDVIFNGAEGYGPMGLAEVNLTLENEGGPFPANWMKYSEIMVTRRLHRSGESEYLINKEPARLRDVQEIFMDTGAGAKGFSIIEQGAIGKIITAKPEERRHLIEEAAGITKFKVRKRESQRKLQATEQNLLRLQDIIAELKRQIDSVQRQAKKAERYREVKVRLEELDLWLSTKKLLSLQNEAQEAEKIFTTSQDAEIAGRTELENLEAELQSLKLTLVEQEKQVEVIQLGQESLQMEVRKKEMLLQQLKFEVEEARRNEARTDSERSDLSARKDILDRELTSIRENLAQIKTESEALTSQFEQKNEAYVTIKNRVDEIDGILTDERRQLITVSQSASQAEARLQSLQVQFDSLQEKQAEAQMVCAELVEKRSEFEKNRNQVSQELEGKRQMQLSIMQDVDNFELNYNQLTDKVKDMRSEADGLKDELNETTSRLYGLETLHANFEGFQEGVKNVMLWQRQDGNKFLPLSEVVSVPAEYELSMEAALGSRLQMLISETQADTLSAVDYLKDQKLGRSSFISTDEVQASLHLQNIPSGPFVKAILTDVVSAPHQHQKAVQQLLSGVAVVENIRAALELRPQHPGWSFVTTEGDTLTTDGILTGGTAESADAGVLKRRREMKELSLKKEELSGKLTLLLLTLKKLENQQEGVEKDLQNAKKYSFEQEIKIAERRKDLERAEVELVNAQRALDKQQSELSQINLQTEQLEQRIIELTQTLKDLTAQKFNLEESVTALLAEWENSKIGIGSLQEETTRLRVESAEKRQETEGLARQELMMANSLAEVEMKLSATFEAASKISETLSANEILLQEDTVQLDKMISEMVSVQNQASQVKDAYESAHARTREFEERVMQIRRSQNQMQSSMNEAKLKFEQSKMKETYLLEQVKERYMLDLTTLVDKYKDQEGDELAADAEINDLKDKLKKIGEVNLSAIEEYDEISKRYEFLSRQQEDLVNAKEELRKVIDRINRICTRRFKETFEAVNDRFTKAFPVLFGGGEAHLTLVENEDKSEMGIDIMARPPGKKLQSVTLLSGGEKALTAVALIFSIFLVKPSPFCLLDEVDAPLDDANVFRFNDLVKEMAKRSQIIVVTHNKHTMEINEKLYGVTMQERGVSKMVSVSLHDAARLVETNA